MRSILVSTLVVATMAMSPAMAGPVAVEGLLGAGDDGRRCWRSDPAAPLVAAPAGQAAADGLVLSLGRYVIDANDGSTALLFGLGARTGPALGAYYSGGCRAEGGVLACVADCAGSSFTIAAVSGGAVELVAGERGLAFFTADGRCAGASVWLGNAEPAKPIRLLPAPAAGCEPMIVPLELRSVK
jgi:hypothetical protein